MYKSRKIVRICAPDLRYNKEGQNIPLLSNKMNTCSYIGKNGQECKARPVKGTTLCYWHTPSFKEANILASSKGGQNRRLQGAYGDAVELRTPRDVQKFLSDVINAVWTGKIPVQVGTSMGFMTKCWLDVYKEADRDELGLGRFAAP